LRILVVAPYDITRPAWGGARRIFDLVESLGGLAEVHLLQGRYCPPESLSKTAEFPGNVTILEGGKPARWTQVFNPWLFLKGLRLARRQGFDYVIASFPWTGIQAYPISFLTRTPMIVDEHNVEYKRFAEIGKGNYLARKSMKILERFFCRRSEFVFSVSENDRKDLARLFDLAEDRLLLVPNGVNTCLFKPDPDARAATRESLGIGPETHLVLFVGNLVYAPNHEAAGMIRDEIAPRIIEEGRDAAFVVVGEKAPDFDSGDELVFTGLVDSVAEYFNACDVSIAPLIAGGGTRLKILESLACGRRVVSTTKGAEGIEECDSVVISDNWEDFSRKVVENWDTGYDKEAVEFARRHGWNSIARSVYDVLAERL
jgi:polysaccharide biosynthesis protein PslH